MIRSSTRTGWRDCSGCEEARYAKQETYIIGDVVFTLCEECSLQLEHQLRRARRSRELRKQKGEHS